MYIGLSLALLYRRMEELAIGVKAALLGLAQRIH
jgi:hypothetical protein